MVLIRDQSDSRAKAWGQPSTALALESRQEQVVNIESVMIISRERSLL
jgi:hypothetical protein